MKWLPTGLWLALLLSAFFLRLQAMSEPLWLDELHTSWVVSDGPIEIHQRAWEGNQLPLFYWLVWPVSKITGGSPFGLRLISLLASMATIVSLGWFVFSWGKSQVGALLVAALDAFDDKFLFYSVEARPYALVQLVGLWQMASFLTAYAHWKGDGDSARHTSNSGKRMAGWLAVLLLWLQPTTIILLAAEALYLVMACFRGMDVRRTFRLSGNWSEPLIMGVMAAWPLVAVLLLTENSHRWARFVDPASFSLGVIADICVWIGIPLLASLFLLRIRCSEDNGIRGKALFWISGLAIASTIISTFGGFVPLADYRYLIAPITGLLMCGGLVVAGLPRAGRCAVALLIMAVAIASNPLLPGFLKTGRMPAQRVEDWATIVAKMNSDNAPVCFFPNLVEDVVLENKSSADIYSRQEDDYFLFALAGTRNLRGLEDSTRVCEAFSIYAAGEASDRLKESIVSEKGCWVLIRARSDDAKIALGKVLDWPGLNFVLEKSEDFSIPPLHLYRLQTQASRLIQ